MQGISRSQIIPAVSSREAFAEIDARKAREAEVLELSPAELIAEHTGDTSFLREVVIVREGDFGTGNELHIEVEDHGTDGRKRIALWAKDPVFWFNPEELAELISRLSEAHVQASS